MKLRHIKAGEVVIEEGDRDFMIYMLSKGCLEIIKGDMLIAELTEKNTIFGEISSLLMQPRSCTVKAKEESEVLEIGDCIDEIIKRSPILTRSILLTLASRLADTTGLLLADDKKPLYI